MNNKTGKAFITELTTISQGNGFHLTPPEARFLKTGITQQRPFTTNMPKDRYIILDLRQVIDFFVLHLFS
ncbi:MAG: hypothetical protein OEL66_08045, partial [Desulfobulbaceae bacterium]|nr:hypothetical protein [Desulfobulbaceae bacterium]